MIYPVPSFNKRIISRVDIRLSIAICVESTTLENLASFTPLFFLCLPIDNVTTTLSYTFPGPTVVP